MEVSRTIRIVADGGSSSVQWGLIRDDGEVQKVRGASLSPLFRTEAEIAVELERVFGGCVDTSAVESVAFYGAACGPDQPGYKVRESLQRFFPDAEVVVDSDMVAAGVACWGNGEGVVGIIGTGSNAGYYAGGRLEYAVPSVGYILGDEGSGARLGIRLVHDWLYGIAPEAVCRELEALYGAEWGVRRDGTGVYTSEGIVRRVYEGETPNAFLAGFARYLLERQDVAYCHGVLEEGFGAFVSRICLPNLRGAGRELRAVGSVAWYGRKVLDTACQKEGLTLGKVVREPIEELVRVAGGREWPGRKI